MEPQTVPGWNQQQGQDDNRKEVGIGPETDPELDQELNQNWTRNRPGPPARAGRSLFQRPHRASARRQCGARRRVPRFYGRAPALQ